MAAVPGRRPEELHLLPGHRRNRHGCRRRDRAVSRCLCWPRSPSTRPVPKACCSSRAAGTAGTCCSSRTAACTTSTTSWARSEQKLSSPGAIPLGRHIFGVRLRPHGHGGEQPHAARRSHPLHRRRRRRVHVGCEGASGNASDWPVRRSASGATPARRCRARSRPRTLSPAAPSLRSTSTSRARRMWTWKKNSHWPSRRTDDERDFGWTALVLLCLMASLASGCVRTDDGVAVRSDEAAAATSVRPQPTTQSTEDAGPAAPGVVATSRAPIPPDTVTCSQPVKPAVEAVAQVSDPAGAPDHRGRSRRLVRRAGLR